MAIIGSFGNANPDTLIGGFSNSNNTGALTVTSISELPSLRLSELIDVDTSLRQDGSIIMWDMSSGSYKVGPIIENANVSVVGGSF
jgi:hypothetical protein